MVVTEGIFKRYLLHGHGIQICWLDKVYCDGGGSGERALGPRISVLRRE